MLSVKESMRAASDEEILARAQADQRLVVTQDKDFGELAFRAKLPAASGIILFRLSGTDSDQDNRRMLEVLESALDWTGNFSAVDEKRIRIRIRIRAMPEVP